MRDGDRAKVRDGDREKLINGQTTNLRGHCIAFQARFASKARLFLADITKTRRKRRKPLTPTDGCTPAISDPGQQPVRSVDLPLCYMLLF